MDRNGTGLNEGELLSLASNAKLAIQGYCVRFMFDGNPRIVDGMTAPPGFQHQWLGVNTSKLTGSSVVEHASALTVHTKR